MTILKPAIFTLFAATALTACQGAETPTKENMPAAKAEAPPESESDYTIDPADTVLGEALRIQLTDETDQILISYRTSPKAEGLQWLSPEQTAGKKYPFLFSQAQALNARTMAPLQDTPAVRMTYSATLRVPDGLLPLMSASQGAKDENGEYRFEMPQPIPSYLLAIAVGDIKFKPINDHIGVYAEDYILDAAAEEFSETPQMEEANTKLYGPYRSAAKLSLWRDGKPAA